MFWAHTCVSIKHCYLCLCWWRWDHYMYHLAGEGEDKINPIEKEVKFMINLDSIKKQILHFANKSPCSQNHGFSRSLVWMWERKERKVKSLSCVWLFAAPWTVAYKAPLSMEFSRQGYWSGLPFPSPGDLPNPGIEPGSPTLQADALTSEPPGK